MRRLVRETRPSDAKYILPFFVTSGTGVKQEIPSLPGVYRHSIDTLVTAVAQARDEGVQGVILFGIPESKDAEGSGAWSADGIAQRAMRALKEKAPGMLLVADVCLCEYTDHGHCGVIEKAAGGRGSEPDAVVVANDPTHEMLGRTAV